MTSFKIPVKISLTLLLLYFFCRLLFWWVNINLFSYLPTSEILFAFLIGTKYDFLALIYFNIPLLLLATFFCHKYWFKTIFPFVFVSINALSIFINLLDIAYFPFAGKRSTIDLFNILALGKDFGQMFCQVVIDYWELIGIFLLLIAAIYFLSKFAIESFLILRMELNSKQKIIILFFLIMVFVLLRFCILPIPQTKINLQLIPLTYNSPFIFLESCFTKISSEEDVQQYDINRKYKPANTDSIPPNVIIIIVESLSKEYVGKLSGQKSYTPFLDALIDSSLVFTNAYANGRKSVEALPAILCGLPALIDAPFIVSAYKNNQLNSLPKILQKNNYTTSFFHGGTDGCLGFNNFCKQIGLEQYYGRKEFNNDKYFDGNWGIWDEPFLSFTADKLNEMQNPFFACIFTLSSHHPYKIPEVYLDKLEAGTLPIHQSIQYADIALRHFFEKARKSEWFRNTLFVITGDHTSLCENIEYSTTIGKYKVPLVFYTPNKRLLGKNNNTSQHIDIMPSIIDYVGIADSFKAFGESVFTKARNNYAFNYINNTYQIFNEKSVLQITDNKVTAYYNIQRDSLLLNNLFLRKEKKRNKMEKELKDRINSYHYTLSKDLYY